MRYKISLLPILVIVAFVVGFITLLKGCLGKYDSYGVEGWPAFSKDNKITTAVTVENNTTSYTQRGGFTSINYASTYFISAYENASGKLLKRKKLIELNDLRYKPLRAYGGYNNLLWVFADGLKAFDVNTLEEVVNEEKLATANPFIKNKFPNQQQFIQSLVPKGFINFTAIDGIKYTLDLTTLQIKPQEEEEDKMAVIASFNLNPFFMNNAADFGMSADTLEGKMYTLAASAKNIPTSFTWTQSGNNNNQRAILFRLAYTTKSFGQHSIFYYSDTVKFNSNAYINGNFLRDAVNGMAVHVSNPGGYLVLHQNLIGNDASVMITRIDTANNKIWEVNTGLSTKISYCGLNGNYCIIFGQVSAKKSPFPGNDGFIIIDLANGKLTSTSLK